MNKIYISDGYYHIYGRGRAKSDIFKDEEDYSVFLNLFKRYLSKQPVKDSKGREYPWLYNDIELLAYCLMPNHFHALVYQYQPQATTSLFKPLITTYGMYFNKKYKSSGQILESRFKASLIGNDAYLTHISRYIHLNPRNYNKWKFSSLPYYLGARSAEWLKPERIINLFNDREDYKKFVDHYVDHQKMLDEIKSELAN